MSHTNSHIVVFDLGKTHIKLCVLDQQNTVVLSKEIDNHPLVTSPYPHADIEGIWLWLTDSLKEITSRYSIKAISITTHGATGVVVDVSNQDNGLALPVLDYEFDGFSDTEADYQQVRPDFSESYSPNLPAGLNLGRQFHWLNKTFTKAFSKATHLLMYPQYWSWRLGGELCNEVTSLGCHTDLWAVSNDDYSSLVDKMNWRHLMPNLQDAWQVSGCITPQVSSVTGLSSKCEIFTGVHDTNASFLRHKTHQQGKPFTVISTGTWAIAMASGALLNELNEHKDMLANVDVQGQAIACARFMGGREYGAICQLTGADLTISQSDEQIESTIDKFINDGVMVLPCFSECGGPFHGHKGEVIGKVNAEQGALLASLYCALMLDYQLDALGASGDIIIEGVYVKNNAICRLLAQLRAPQKVYVSADDTGTIQGCALLTQWSTIKSEIELKGCHATDIKLLQRYKQNWLLKIAR